MGTKSSGTSCASARTGSNGRAVVDRAALLAETVKDLHKNETFERALGRILRRHGHSYEAYRALMDELRERSRREGVDLLVMARRVASGEDLGVE